MAGGILINMEISQKESFLGNQPEETVELGQK